MAVYSAWTVGSQNLQVIPTYTTYSAVHAAQAAHTSASQTYVNKYTAPWDTYALQISTPTPVSTSGYVAPSIYDDALKRATAIYESALASAQQTKSALDTGLARGPTVNIQTPSEWNLGMQVVIAIVAGLIVSKVKL